MKRWPQWLMILLVIGVILGNYPLPAQGSTEHVKPHTIRVAYPLQEGLTMIDGQGNFYGYTYEYLMEIAKYTGWRYEFVTFEGNSNEQAMAALNALQSEEIDLLGSLNYAESLAEVLAYPGYHYGMNYMGIYVPYDSTLSENSLYNVKDIRIGVYRKNLQKDAKLEQFAQMNNLPIEQVVTDSARIRQEMLDTGEVDAILSTDLAVYEHKGMRPIARFSPTPFYIATQSGNVDMVRQLDYAISIINSVDPNFSVDLYNRYFTEESSGFRLSNDEKNYIETAAVQEVLLYGNNPPYCYQDEKTGELNGIMIAFFQKLSEDTGLQFRYHTANTYEAYSEYVQQEQADIIINMLSRNQEAMEATSISTVPWHSVPLYTIYKEGAEWDKEPLYAMPYFLRNAIETALPVVYYDTTEQCLQAVQQGKVYGAYVGGFEGQYFINSGKYPKLRLIEQPWTVMQQVSLGIADKDDFYMLAILNRWISSVSTEEIDEIIYKHTFRQQSLSLGVWLENHFWMVLLIGVICFLAIYIFVKNREQRRIAIENQRYNILSNLSNEFFYEYNLQKDELVLPEKSADYFACGTPIKGFSHKVNAIPAEERTGIWQIGEAIIENRQESQEISCQMADNTLQWFRLFCTPVYNDKRQLYISGKIANIQDVKTEQIRLEQKAFVDGLTGIYNIMAVQNLVKQRLENFDQCAPCAFVVLDVDNFKQMNDRLGHYNGDVILIQVASLLAEVFRPHLVGRLGGDEFVIFAERTSKDEMEEKCRRLAHEVLVKLQERFEIVVHLSLGITITEVAKSYETLYQEADQALYQKKFAGKNGYAFYQPQDDNVTSSSKASD